MKIQKYLKDLLENSGAYVPTLYDSILLEKEGIKGYIKAKIFSKKFRKWKVDDLCVRIVDEEIEKAISEKRQINVFFAQGSYKLWRVASAPRVNWAEFFNIAYLISYLSPIALAYPQGVELTYYLLTVLPQTHNNLSEKEVWEYKSSFQCLLNEFSKYLPNNLRVKIVTDIDLHNRQLYDHMLIDAMTVAKDRFCSWPEAKQDDYMRRAWLNIKWDGVENWTQFNDEQKTRIVEKAVLYEYAATQDILVLDKKGKGIILSTLPKDDSVGIGSTHTSVAKHWVGEGVIEVNDYTFYPRILSPSQYEIAEIDKHETIKINLLPYSEFSEIEIFSKHFDFAKK